MKSKSDHSVQYQRDAYRKPILTLYGDIAQLTRTSGGDVCIDNENAFHHQKADGLNCDGTPES
jgi:hypothetical protein